MTEKIATSKEMDDEIKRLYDKILCIENTRWLKGRLINTYKDWIASGDHDDNEEYLSEMMIREAVKLNTLKSIVKKKREKYDALVMTYKEHKKKDLLKEIQDIVNLKDVSKDKIGELKELLDKYTEMCE